MVNDFKRKYQQIIPTESYKIHKNIGFQQNLRYMPQYFI